MNIGSVNESILSQELKAEQIKELYDVKLLEMEQESEEIVGDLLQDTVEISQEAMERYLAEVNAK